MSVALSSNLTQRQYPWLSWKAVYAVKGSLFQYEDDGLLYTIWTYDGPEIHTCQIWKGTVPDSLTSSYSQAQNDSDKTDFENNYKSLGNQALSQNDTDGAAIVRNKAAKKGWTFCSLPFEFETSRRSDHLYAKDYQGNDRSFISLKIYDADNNEITTDGIANINWDSAVKTVIDFEPPYDYEVIGGDIRTLTSISSDVRLWLVAAPDIAAPTGSKEMGGGINLRYLAPGNVWSVDGRVTKYATYNATYHTGKIRLILKYPAGTNESLQVIVQFYKL
jgi:hypothetical protein